MEYKSALCMLGTYLKLSGVPGCRSYLYRHLLRLGVPKKARHRGKGVRLRLADEDDSAILNNGALYDNMDARSKL